MAVLAPIWLWWILAALNALALVLTVIDKLNAQRGRRRIRERTLLGLALVGGSLGLLVGMVLVHHKVRKRTFLLRLLAIVCLQTAVVLLFDWYGF